MLGISQAGNPNNPLLNAPDKSVNIPPGTYYTYNLPPATFNTAARVTIRWSDSGTHTDTAIFAVGSLTTAAQWTWLSGATNITWASTGLTNVTKVTQTLTPGTSPDNVFQLGVQASASTGSGPQISVTPASLSFGNVAVGQSGSLPLTVTNTGNGSGTLNVTNISVALPFSVVAPSAPIALAAGASATVTVKFTPTPAGAQSGSLTMASNDSAHPNVTVPLSGTGMSGTSTGGLPSRPAGSTLDTSNPLATNLAGLFLMNEGSGTTDRNLVDGQTAAFAGTTLPTWNTADPSIVFNGVLNGSSLSTYLNAGTAWPSTGCRSAR